MANTKSHRRTQLLLWGIVGVFALVAVALFATAGERSNGFTLLGFGEAQGSTGAGTREIDQFGSEDGGAPTAQDSVTEFAATHGDPPNTDFARLRIPAINVDAPVGRWIVEGSVMPEPYGPVDVAFYDLEGWSGIGGFPGDGRNAVFGAHVDMNRDIAYAGAHYRGPAVFWSLDELGPGSIIEVDYAGETLRYAVVWAESVAAGDGTDWRQYWSSDVAADSITLFTCGGDFDFDSLSYSHRIVVRAERI
ncbi:MAG: class F sortase [Dehalococcoidia bacterium]